MLHRSTLDLKGMTETLNYFSGYGSYISSEALPNSLPELGNSPQVCPYGLYPEQINGTAFTAPRGKNFRSWLYKIRPSAGHTPFVATTSQSLFEDLNNLEIDPTQIRWSPLPLEETSEHIDFVQGMKLYCASGEITTKEGIAIYNYTANASMEDKAFYNSDGDFLIVPQEGSLFITTEMGRFVVEPCEIIVIPRGIKFSVQLQPFSSSSPSPSPSPMIRGYVLEVFKGHFEIPSLGPIGANGLANPRDFLVCSAWFEDRENPSSSSSSAGKGEGAVEGENLFYSLVTKYMGKLFSANMDHSPFDVVAWHGNYYPFKYDLRKFNTVNTVSYDHMDPSIFTVLTVPTDEPGTAAADFVIFPPRWMVAENTFRPPYYHRNCMSEYMGMIYGKYDAKEGGFLPGGSSLHSCMTSHGPDVNSFIKGSTCPLTPTYQKDGIAFMFESTYLLKISRAALSSPQRQMDYTNCWRRPLKLFTGELTVTFPPLPSPPTPAKESEEEK